MVSKNSAQDQLPSATSSIWRHSSRYLGELTGRARNEVPVLTCEAQLADILRPLVKPGTTLLDVGCATGYYYRTLKSLGVEYYGIDSCPEYIEAGRREMPHLGLEPRHLRVMAAEDLDGQTYDVVVCFNTLLYCANYHLPLERLAQSARHFLVIRTLLGPATVYRYEEDGYLDKGWNYLRAYFNIYSMEEVKTFLRDLGFRVSSVVDRRTNDQPEMVIGKVHPWRILLCQRQEAVD